MVCDSCGKQQATVHLTEIVNNKMSELHLCDVCAQGKGTAMKQHFSLADLLAGLSDVGSMESETARPVVCPGCSLAYQDFKKVGRLGCSECYAAFKLQLAPLLKRIHGATRHVGRVPEGTSKTAEARHRLEDLKKRLDRAIELEEYEEAAKLRDELRRAERAGRARKKRAPAKAPSKRSPRSSKGRSEERS